MFSSMMRLKNEEKVLMFAGILFTALVFYFINFYFTGQGMIFWALVETGIMWLIIISLHLLSDNSRQLNDELKEIIHDLVQENKNLKQISQEQLEEVKLLKGIGKEAISLMKKRK